VCFEAILSKYMEAVKSYSYIDEQPQEQAYSAHRNDRKEIHRRFYSLLSTIFLHDLAFVLYGQRNAQLSTAVTNGILEGCVDPTGVTNRLCFRCLQKLYPFWMQGQVNDSMKQTMVNEITGRCFQFYMSNLNPEDVETVLAMRESCMLLWTLGNENQQYYNFLGECLVTQLGWSQQAAQQFLTLMAARQYDAMKSAMQEFMIERRARVFNKKVKNRKPKEQ